MPAILAALCVTLQATIPEARIESALHQAGDNRAQLQRVLDHYADSGDRQKLEAARFLIANMPGHGYVVTRLFDGNKNEIPFDALDFKNFKTAQARLDELEKQHGTVAFKRKEFIEDVRTIKAEFLIENIDLAFDAWRNNAWSSDISFDLFCEFILPYRGSNEPLEPWRSACRSQLTEVHASLGDTTDGREVAKRIRKVSDKWVRFRKLFYLHPTDQSYSEMLQNKAGRCEDMTNMTGYAMRASGVIFAADYTPYWANRDNNHAWEVILDAEGKGSAGLHNIAAKVYRKVFSRQMDSLAEIKRDGEKVPRWLDRSNYIDVTDQYFDTTDVSVALSVAPPDSTRFAYLCVFNGGKWKPIHWSAISTQAGPSSTRATFTRMGRNIVYLPGYYIDDKIVPAAPPFVLDKRGAQHPLVPDTDRKGPLQIDSVVPEIPDADTQSVFPTIKVKAGEVYELFVWSDGWQSLGRCTAGDQPVGFDSVPICGLYWLKTESGRDLERIFTVENGAQQMW
jgi:hypothetical protein